jgi:predicted DNA-binding protein (MmcQ/YjbR family)
MAATNFDEQRKFAAGLPGATEDIKWGADLVYSIGAKMFCVFLLEGNRVGGHTKSCSFKVDDDRFLELTGVPGVMPAPYLARAKWVQVKPGHALGSTALSELIRRSHALVLAKLPKKTQAEALEGLS